jgi:SAM-dependent methyltransferase
LAEAVKGRSVLDIGIVAHTHDAYQSESWLHRHLAQNAASCLGCGIIASEIEHLRSLCFNVICHDITREPLNESFDAIVCGELIENIDLSGKLFENCVHMLNQGGKLYITTPNPWFLTYMIKSACGGSALVDSVDHVAWYDPATLFELGARYGLRLQRYSGIRATRTYTRPARFLFAMAQWLPCLGFRRELLAMSMIYEFVHA